MREHVDRVLHVVVQGQPVLDVEGVVQVNILQKQFIGCVQNNRFLGQSWETRFLDHFGPSRLSWTVLANLGYFGLLWGNFGPMIWSPNIAFKTLLDTFLGAPCK